jgi:hypothetical protein
MQHDELCFQLKALLSGVSQDEEIQYLIGKLGDSPDELFQIRCEEIRAAVHSFLCGQWPTSERPLTLLNYSAEGVTKTPAGNDFPSTGVRSLDDAFALYQQDRNRCLHILTGLMKLKTGRMIPGPSRSEESQIYESITQRPTWDENIVQMVENEIGGFIYHFFRQHRRLDLSKRKYKPLIAEYMNPQKTSFVNLPSGNIDFTTFRNNVTCFNTRYFLTDKRVQRILKNDPNSIIASVYTGVDVEGGEFLELENPQEDNLIVGVIRVIREPGGKNRVVAVPNMFLKCASAPLGSLVKQMNSAWRIQGVDSHESCVSFISNKMDGVKTFYSIDMKNFTDRLPYRRIQRRILEFLVVEGRIKQSDLDIMDLICEGTYVYNKTKVQYGAGTPQGTEPSFPLCSFTNGMIAAIAFKLSTGINWEQISLDRLPVRVIGDDIQIWHDGTAHTYRALMQGLGVVESKDKTIVSNLFAEMCSKVISPEGVYQQKKVIRREDRKIPLAQTISSRIEYYSKIGEDVLGHYLNFANIGLETLATIMSAPREAGGQGDSFKQICKKLMTGEPVTALEGHLLLKRFSAVLRQNRVTDRESLEQFYARVDLLPKMRYKLLDPDDQKISRIANPLLQTLARDFARSASHIYKTVMRPFGPLPDHSREEVCHSINAMKLVKIDPSEILDKSKELTQALASRGNDQHVMDRWLRKRGEVPTPKDRRQSRSSR